jgi:hypothetical protein
MGFMTDLDAAWEALAEELRRDYGNVSTRLLLARHRPLIEAEAIAAERARIRAALVATRVYLGEAGASRLEEMCAAFIAQLEADHA